MQGNVVDKTRSVICEASAAVKLAKESQSGQRDVNKDGQDAPPAAPSRPLGSHAGSFSGCAAISCGSVQKLYKVTNSGVDCVVWLCKSNDSRPFCRVQKVNNLLTFCTLPRDATCGCVEVTNRNVHFFVHFREL